MNRKGGGRRVAEARRLFNDHRMRGEHRTQTLVHHHPVAKDRKAKGINYLLSCKRRMASTETTRRRRGQENNFDVTNYQATDLDGRRSTTIPPNYQHQQEQQQQQRQQHHNHHHHYHHHYHHFPRHASGNQDAGRVPLPTSSSPTNILSRLFARHNQLSSSDNHMVPSSSEPHEASGIVEHASEARDSRDERVRNAASLSHRYISADLAARFLDEFSLLFDDEDEIWSDDELWELGIQDWLAAWDFEERWQVDPALSDQLSVSAGLSKSVIRHLQKEVYLPKGTCRDSGTGGNMGTGLSQQDDCSVCLEHFVSGQSLICLPCKHRFHSDCLRPWLESHGQCPYCRANIICEDTDEATLSSRSSSSAYLNEDDLLALMEPMLAGFSTLNVL